MQLLLLSITKRSNKNQPRVFHHITPHRLCVCVCTLCCRPVKSPLKVQNGVQETNSPVKKVVKRSRQILDSDDDDSDGDEAPVVKENVSDKRQGDKGVQRQTEKVNKKKSVDRKVNWTGPEINRIHVNVGVNLTVVVVIFISRRSLIIQQQLLAKNKHLFY